MPRNDKTERDEVHQQVSKAYTEAISAATDSESRGCCRTPAGFAARSAGYGEEVEALPEGAAEASFGCGNPLAFAGVEAGHVVLDLGAGAGLDLLIAARKVGSEGRVIGVDMTEAMIETARRNIHEAGFENVEVRQGLIEALPVDDSSVDWVISNCVINLSPEKPRVFAEIARVLRPGGRFSISDIVAEDLPAELREIAALHAACIAGAISETAYIAGLEAAGLADVTVDRRLVYDEQQLAGITAGDLEALGLDPALLQDKLSLAVGKVWSAHFSGRKP
ncbi:MAG TPA: arsenite methyltransferase [Acidobacteria bacterium]|nr:arsenite methyltransferase [Acidobacteriota bacterium]